MRELIVGFNGMVITEVVTNDSLKARSMLRLWLSKGYICVGLRHGNIRER
jgi:hypothetical protein